MKKVIRSSTPAFRHSALALAIGLTFTTLTCQAQTAPNTTFDLTTAVDKQLHTTNGKGAISQANNSLIGFIAYEPTDTTKQPQPLVNVGGDSEADYLTKINGSIDLVIENLNAPVGSTALNFMQNNSLGNNNASLSRGEYTFTGAINIDVKHASLNSADLEFHGHDNPGLFITNKRRAVTFDDSVKFSVYYNQATAEGGASIPSVLAGVYSAFGASYPINVQEYEKYFGQDLLGSTMAPAPDFDEALWKATQTAKMGHTHFNKGLTLHFVNDINAATESDLNFNAAFGVYVNEGGGVHIKDAANLIVLTSPNADLVSALHASAKAGVLDPFKQGEITITDLKDTSRLWAMSSPKPISSEATPEDVQNVAFQMRDAVEALHGANITIKDGSQNAWVDIRGHIVAGEKNTNAQLNTTNEFNSHVADMRGKVNNANVTLTLNNANSKLFGNVYERHRLGLDEVATFNKNLTVNSSEVFDSWVDFIAKKEANGMLGGQVNFTLANGAMWLPLKDWHGWDSNDAALTPQTIEALATSTTVNRLDQYNLYTEDVNGNKIETHNALTVDGKSVINDNDLVQKDQQGISYVDRGTFDVASGTQKVDNGIHRLKLDGGVVDTRFMRMDFGKVIGVKETNQDFHDYMINITQNNASFDDRGVKSLRIQKLEGQGTFNLFIKDQANHDLLIVDEATNSTNNKVCLWNLTTGNETFGIKDGDKKTFVQVARVDKDMTFDNAITYKGTGSIFEWRYELKKDEDHSISQTQGALMHDLTDNWFLVSANRKVNPNVSTTAVNAHDVPFLFATKIERLHTRMGEVQHARGQDDGHWVRMNHTRDALDGFDAKSWMIELGVDQKDNTEDGVKFTGGALSYMEGDADYTLLESSKSETKRYRGSLYQTWLNDNGSYVDLVGRVGWYTSDFNMNFKDQLFNITNGELDFWAAAASIESGHKFSNEKRWYIEPQVQLQYTYLDGDDFVTNQDVRTSVGHVNSLIGRVGVRIGQDAFDDNTQGQKAWSYHLRGDVLREFDGDRDFTLSGIADRSSTCETYEGERTWYDVGFGITRKFNQNGYFFVDVERQFGDNIRRIWEFNAGLRYHFE